MNFTKLYMAGRVAMIFLINILFVEACTSVVIVLAISRTQFTSVFNKTYTNI